MKTQLFQMILILVCATGVTFAQERREMLDSEMRPAELLSSLEEASLFAAGLPLNTGSQDQSFIISLIPGSHQTRPAAVHNSTQDQYLVVWEDERNMAVSGRDIYGVLLDSKGQPLSDSFPIVIAPRDQLGPAVAYNSKDDQYLVVWADERNMAISDRDIYGQLVGADGLLIRNNFPISMVIGAQFAPAVAYNDIDNRYMVVWTDERDRTARGSHIYGQLVSADGHLIGSDLPLSTALGNQLGPSIAYNDTDNEYLIAWEDGRNGRNDIYGQRIAAEGRLIGGDLRISTTTQWKRDPAIAYNDADNEYLVVWQDWVYLTVSHNRYEIYGQRLTHEGISLGVNFPITTIRGWHFLPKANFNPIAREYLVVWRNFSRIYGLRINTNGSLVGTTFPISPNSAGWSFAVAAYNSIDDEHLVVWPDDRNMATNGLDIYGQRVSLAGGLLKDNIHISPDPDPPGPTPAPRFQAASSVVYNSYNNQYMVIMSDGRRSSSYSGTYAQVIDPSGLLLGENFPLTGAFGGVGQLAYNSIYNKYFFVWVDVHTGTEDIYGQILDDMGNPVGPSFTIATGTARHYAPSVAYNSTGNQYLVAWNEWPGFEATSIYGQRVAADGRLISRPFIISAVPQAHRMNPNIAYNNTNNDYLVVFASSVDPSTQAIYGQRVGGDGRLLGENFSIAMAPNLRGYASAAYNETANQYLVVWDDERAGFPMKTIYGQRVDADGHLLGQNFPISTAPRRQQEPNVVYNSTDELYFVVWSDERRGQYLFDIYGQRVATDGRLLGGNFPICTASGAKATPKLSYNSADNQYLVVWTDTRNYATSETDVYGQLIP